MRRFAIAAAIMLLAGVAQAQVVRPEEPYWTPDAAVIAQLEAGLEIRPFSDKQATYELAQYDRYYYGMTLNGQRAIRGVFILPANREDNPKTQAYITEKPYMPRVIGAGCASVSLVYIVDKNHSTAECDMLGGAPPPSEQPHWKPDEETAARLETALQERMKQAGLRDLSHFGRYYRGVTLDGKPMIRASIIDLRDIHSPANTVDREPHLVSESDDVPIIFDGGCSNIRATYDVKGAKFTELTCNEQGGAHVLKP